MKSVLNQYDRFASTNYTSDPFHFIYFFIKSYKKLYHFNRSSTMETNFFLTPKELNYFGHQIFNVITQLSKWKKRTDIEAIHTQISKRDNFIYVSRDYLEIRIKNLLEEDKIENKISSNFDSYYLNEEKIIIELINSMHYSPPRFPKAQILITPTGDRSTYSISLPESVVSDYPNTPITLQSLKQDYSGLYVQSVSIKDS